jgi:hypothetical protein
VSPSMVPEKLLVLQLTGHVGSGRIMLLCALTVVAAAEVTSRNLDGENMAVAGFGRSVAWRVADGIRNGGGADTRRAHCKPLQPTKVEIDQFMVSTTSKARWKMWH